MKRFILIAAFFSAAAPAHASTCLSEAPAEQPEEVTHLLNQYGCTSCHSDEPWAMMGLDLKSVPWVDQTGQKTFGGILDEVIELIDPAAPLARRMPLYSPGMTDEERQVFIDWREKLLDGCGEEPAESGD